MRLHVLSWLSVLFVSTRYNAWTGWAKGRSAEPCSQPTCRGTQASLCRSIGQWDAVPRSTGICMCRPARCAEGSWTQCCYSSHRYNIATIAQLLPGLYCPGSRHPCRIMVYVYHSQAAVNVQWTFLARKNRTLTTSQIIQNGNMKILPEHSRWWSGYRRRRRMRR